MPTLSDPPLQTQVVDNRGVMTGHWSDWIVAPGSGEALGLKQAVEATIYRPTDPTILTNQHDAIATTAFSLGTLPGGLYRVSWYLQILIADGVASSATVTIGWTSDGHALTASGVAVNGDTTSTFQTTGTGIIQSDAGSPITFAVSYASTTANKMNFKIALVIEKLS